MKGKFLKRFRISECKPINTPILPRTKLRKYDNTPIVNSTFYKKLVGILMHLTTKRHDIMYLVNLISSFMKSPKETHWNVIK